MNILITVTLYMFISENSSLFIHTQPLKAPISTNEFSTLISIHFLRELLERILLRDQSIFSLVNIGFSLDDELILLVDVVDVGQSRHSKG